MRVVVVTGVSGAGKSTALKALEDLGYYCVDNMPLPLLGRFVELLSTGGDVTQAALGVDAREGEFLLGHREAFASLREHGHEVEVLYLEANDDALVRRFSETRRRHPLAGDLREGIRMERDILKSLHDEASAVIDTANLNVHQLKGVVGERYGRAADELAVTLISFGFKHGLPVEADYVFDVRFLPNPYFVEALSAASGQEAAVASFVLDNADAREFLERIEGLIAFVLPRAESEGKAYLTIAIGCTGGRHRSVAVAEALSKKIPTEYAATVRHRDLHKGGHP